MTLLYDPAFKANEDLAGEILALTREAPAAGPEPGGAEAPKTAGEPERRAPRREGPLRGADCIVSHIEVNDRHGVGVLLRRLFSGYSNVLSIRSEDHFGGRQEFGDCHLRISHRDPERSAVTRSVREALGETTVSRILAVPYYPDDARNALAVQEVSGAPLCLYLMDDQNVFDRGIPDGLMRELIDRARLCLAISTDLAACYEAKYGRRFWLMPPVVAARHILPWPLPVEEVLANPREGLILGNIWGQKWLDLLRSTVRGSGITLRWYSTNLLRYLRGEPGELAADGIVIHDGPPLDDTDLIPRARRAAFTVVPSGTLDEDDDRRFIARLSFPSRIPFLMATAHTPVIVLGHPDTGAARFVAENGIGLAAGYDSGLFRAAVERVTHPAENLTMRRRALALAGRLTDAGAAEWLWQSLARAEPFDRRHEDWLRRSRPDLERLVREGPARLPDHGERP